MKDSFWEERFWLELFLGFYLKRNRLFGLHSGLLDVLGLKFSLIVLFWVEQIGLISTSPSLIELLVSSPQG